MFPALPRTVGHAVEEDTVPCTTDQRICHYATCICCATTAHASLDMEISGIQIRIMRDDSLPLNLQDKRSVRNVPHTSSQQEPAKKMGGLAAVLLSVLLAAVYTLWPPFESASRCNAV